MVSIENKALIVRMTCLVAGFSVAKALGYTVPELNAMALGVGVAVLCIIAGDLYADVAKRNPARARLRD